MTKTVLNLIGIDHTLTNRGTAVTDSISRMKAENVFIVFDGY
jgi:hypothetical protein